MKFKTFKPRFHPLILSGQKQTTIRERALIAPGEVFALRYWTGAAYRSPMGTLGTATCQGVQTIEIGSDDALIDGFIVADLDQMAKLDGFASWVDMREYFLAAGGLPFIGARIVWGDTFRPVVVEGRP